MTRTLLFLASMAATVWGATLVAQSVPEINYDANASIISLPSYGEVAGVATNSRGHVFVYARTGHAVATLGDERTFYHGGSTAVSVRSVRQVRQGDRPGRLCHQFRPAGPSRSPGQHLDRRRRFEPGREVRCGGAVSAGARKKAREHPAAARPWRVGHGGRRRVCGGARRRARWRARRGWGWRRVAATPPVGRPGPGSMATASIGRRT